MWGTCDERRRDAEILAAEQRVGLLEGDGERFLATFELVGHDRPALEAWFRGYAGDPRPTEVEVLVGELGGEGDSGWFGVTFRFSWSRSDDVTERGKYWVSWHDRGHLQRVKTFFLRRDVGPWPDVPDRTPLVLLPPGMGERVCPRTLPAEHPAVVGQVAEDEWTELGAVTGRVQHRPGRIGPRIRLVARDRESLVDAAVLARDWLARTGELAGAFVPACVPGAPGTGYRQRPQSMSGPGLDPGARFDDPVPVPLLVRAVDRLPRYRLAHPQLGPASILSEMMSETCCRWAYRAAASDASGVLAALNGRFSSRVAAGENLPRPPGVPRSERRRLPWGGLDEALALKSTYGQSRATCGTIAPVYAAVLRLSGLSPFEVLTVDMPARLVVVVHLPRATYLVSNHGVMPMTPTTHYWSRDVHRLCTDAWYWDQTGICDRPQAADRHRERFRERLPRFPLPPVARADGPEAEGFWMGSVASFASERELASDVRRYVERESIRRPHSPYTWARYCFQSLRVAHPHVYLRAGLGSVDVEELAAGFHARDDVLRWAEALSRGSIFPEPDRLMTPDQVVRYRRGRPADIACALAALGQLRFGDRPLVRLGGGAFVRWGDPGRWLRTDDMSFQMPTDIIEAVWDSEQGWTRWSTAGLCQSLADRLQGGDRI